MSNDLQKYESWRAITESDYVTMFIKTWFAFIATLREMYPVEDLDKIIGKGDSTFINPYLDNFEQKYSLYNVFDTIKPNILKVYKLGREYVLNNEKYYRFFHEDFYHLNKSFQFEKETDKYKCDIRSSSLTCIVVHILFKDAKFIKEKKPLVIVYKTDFSDLISDLLNRDTAENYLQDEGAYLQKFFESMKRKITLGFIAQLFELKNSKIYSDKVFSDLEILSKQDIYNTLSNSMTAMTDNTIENSKSLYYQVPCANFIFRVQNDMFIPEIEAYKWFLKFVYFLRNALFHEIIDPLEKFWQDIFKQAYLALKEILDGNIKYLQEEDKVKEAIYYRAWEEMKNKPDVYIPNFNEHNNNEDLIINIVDYSVNTDTIELKAAIHLDYWFDSHTIKRVISSCKATIRREKALIANFKMEKKNEEILKQI